MALKVNELFGEHGQFILVSGNADGPSKTGEATAMEFGFPVISFRAVKLLPVNYDDQYAVDEWRLYRGKGQIINHHEPTWADMTSALGYRSLLIAERADAGVAFWDGHSRGTAEEIDYFAAAGKPLEIIKP